MARSVLRLKRGWWQKPAGWALGLTFVLPSALLADPVSKYAGAWALPAEVIGVIIMLAATVGFFVVKRNSWLLAAPLSFGLSFSFGLALVEGWSAQVSQVLAVARVVLILGAIGLTGATIVVVGRLSVSMSHVRSEITRKLGENIAHDSLFRDDGERILIYAHRGRVILRALTIAVAGALFVVGGLWAHSVATTAFWQIVIAVCTGFLLCLCGVNLLLMLIRTVMTSPTLVVNADGILDNGSLIVTGRGLLSWHETLGVEEFVFSSTRGITYRYLDIIVTDSRTINRRQPFWKRSLARFVSQRQLMGFRIQRSLLDRPPAALAAEINHYIHTHAPEGSWHKSVTADASERLSEK